MERVRVQRNFELNVMNGVVDKHACLSIEDAINLGKEVLEQLDEM
ncbi:hypothetical protein [Legionella qingyii]|nr:hypothetical protein [Legionella qingyii]